MAPDVVSATGLVGTFEAAAAEHERDRMKSVAADLANATQAMAMPGRVFSNRPASRRIRGRRRHLPNCAKPLPESVEWTSFDDTADHDCRCVQKRAARMFRPPAGRLEHDLLPASLSGLDGRPGESCLPSNVATHRSDLTSLPPGNAPTLFRPSTTITSGGQEDQHENGRQDEAAEHANHQGH